MKKYLFLLLACTLLSATTFAQNTTPRYGTAPNQDHTGKNLRYGLITLADTAGSTTDTITTNGLDANGLSFYHTDIILTLTDSCVFSWKSIASARLGDKITLIIENTSGSGHFVNFLGYSGLSTKWDMASTGTKLSPNSAKRMTAEFSWDGTAWVELSRSTH